MQNRTKDDVGGYEGDESPAGKHGSAAHPQMSHPPVEWRAGRGNEPCGDLHIGKEHRKKSQNQPVQEVGELALSHRVVTTTALSLAALERVDELPPEG